MGIITDRAPPSHEPTYDTRRVLGPTTVCTRPTTDLADCGLHQSASDKHGHHVEHIFTTPHGVCRVVKQLRNAREMANDAPSHEYHLEVPAAQQVSLLRAVPGAPTTGNKATANQEGTLHSASNGKEREAGLGQKSRRNFRELLDTHPRIPISSDCIVSKTSSWSPGWPNGDAPAAPADTPQVFCDGCWGLRVAAVPRSPTPCDRVEAWSQSAVTFCAYDAAASSRSQ